MPATTETTRSLDFCGPIQTSIRSTWNRSAGRYGPWNMRPFAIVTLALVLSACGGIGGDAAESAIATTSLEQTTAPPSTAVSATTEPTTATTGPAPSETEASVWPLAMSANSIGDAHLGMTVDELTTALGPTFTVSPTDTTYEEGFGARAVSYEGQEVFAVHFDEETDLATVMITTSDRVRTTEGLSPGMSLDDAIAVLGDPTFSFYRFEGGREAVEFATPVEALVRPRSADGQSPAGLYDFEIETDDDIGPFFATDYSPGSTIFSLSIEDVGVQDGSG